MQQAGPIRAWVAGWLAALWAASSVQAAAQSLEVAPISVELAPDQAAASLTLTNHADVAGVIQIRPFAWDQADGEDRLTATKALAVSPPFTTLGPGESQIVRLVLRQHGQKVETAYRVLIDQLPPAAAPGSVRVALRISLPIFTQAENRAAPALHASVIVSGVDAGVLVLTNTGDRRIRLADLKFVGADPAVSPKLRSSAFAYVLAGSERRLALSFPKGPPAPGARFHISAKSDRGDVSFDAAVSP